MTVATSKSPVGEYGLLRFWTRRRVYIFKRVSSQGRESGGARRKAQSDDGRPSDDAGNDQRSGAAGFSRPAVPVVPGEEAIGPGTGTPSLRARLTQGYRTVCAFVQDSDGHCQVPEAEHG